GAVGLRMRVYDRTVCFANFHFAAHLEVVGRRNADFDHVYRTRPSTGENYSPKAENETTNDSNLALIREFHGRSSGKAGFTDGIGSGDLISIPQGDSGGE
ncbi:hypothetical protein FXO38_13003, partial [Capsicum annuum]